MLLSPRAFAVALGNTVTNHTSNTTQSHRTRETQMLRRVGGNKVTSEAVREERRKKYSHKEHRKEFRKPWEEKS